MNKIRPGQMLGDYQIISQIGRGGMAIVYRAYHAAMDRYVAIKVLPHEFMHDETFPGGDFVGLVGLAPFHDFNSQIPQVTKDKLLDIVAALNNGTINTGVENPY